MKLRFIERDGKKILQQWGLRKEWGLPGDDGWHDVPTEVKPDELTYQIAYCYRADEETVYFLSFEPMRSHCISIRLIDERLVEKLVYALSKYAEHPIHHEVLEEYRKWVPKK